MVRGGLYLVLRRKRRYATTRLRNFGSCATADYVKLFIISFVFLVVTCTIGVLLFRESLLGEFNPYFADPSTMLVYKNDTLTFFDRNGEVIYRTPGRYITEIVPLNEISPYMIKATLAAEDKNFLLS